MPHVIAVVTNTEEMEQYHKAVEVLGIQHNDAEPEPEYEAQVVEGYVHPNVAGSVYCINQKEAYAVVEAFNGGEYYSLDAALQAVRMGYRTPAG